MDLTSNEEFIIIDSSETQEGETVGVECINRESEVLDPEVLCDVEFKEGAESVSFNSTSVHNIEGVGLIQTDVDKKGFTEINYVPETGVVARNSQKYGTKFICNYCSFFSRRRYNIERHMITSHNDDGIIKINCDINNWIECSQCDEKLSSRYTYEKHYALNHPYCEKLYTCHYCKLKVNRISYLKKHIFAMHPEHIFINNEDFYHCYLCKYKSTYEFLLHRHLKRNHHLEDSYLCTFCKQRFASSAALRKHKLERHSDHQTFSCNMCEFTTTTRPNLLYHVNGSHKKDMVDMITSSMLDLT